METHAEKIEAKIGEKSSDMVYTIRQILRNTKGDDVEAIKLIAFLFAHGDLEEDDVFAPPPKRIKNSRWFLKSNGVIEGVTRFGDPIYKRIISHLNEKAEAAVALDSPF